MDTETTETRVPEYIWETRNGTFVIFEDETLEDIIPNDWVSDRQREIWESNSDEGSFDERGSVDPMPTRTDDEVREDLFSEMQNGNDTQITAVSFYSRCRNMIRVGDYYYRIIPDSNGMTKMLR